jgi:inorganic triphosphatase YgiF
LIEQEIKLAVTERQRFEEVARAPEIAAATVGEEARIPMDATYIDTAGLDLMRAGLAYRIRWEGDHWVATIKRAIADADAGGYHRHQEWEAPLQEPDPGPDLSVFEDPDLLSQLGSAAGDRPLQPLFRVRVQRRVRRLALDAATQVEWAADDGEILAGEAREPICEVELELKAGPPEPMQSLAQTLQAHYPLSPDTRTKYERGLRLAGLKEAE